MLANRVVVHKRRSMAKLSQADPQSGVLVVQVVKSTVAERSGAVYPDPTVERAATIGAT